MKSQLGQLLQMQTTRRGFIKGLTIGAASLAVSMSALATAVSNTRAGEFSVADLQELCMALTGGRRLESADAANYLSAFQSMNIQKGLTELLKLSRISSGAVLDASIKSANLDDVANTVVASFYSGMVTSNKNLRVITYPNALAWSVLPYTKPNGQCGGEFGYWSQLPAA